MPLMKNTDGRIVAVSQSRVKALKAEGFIKATTEEAAAWQKRHNQKAAGAIEETEEGMTVDAYAAKLDDFTKAKLIDLGAAAYNLDLTDSSTKAELIEAIAGAAEDAGELVLPAKN